jgi:lipopolysaccharide export LptBFGC system permease protein LptF
MYMMVGFHYIPSPLALAYCTIKKRVGICPTTLFASALRKIALVFFLFAALIIFIDIMLHLGDITDKKTKTITWIAYYGSFIAKRFDILLPFAVGISFVQLLELYVRRNQFISLLMTGYSLRRILRPFFLLTSLLCLTLLLHYQFVLPKTLPRLSKIESTDFGRKRADEEFKGIGHLHLPNGERLLFNSYSRSKKTLHQVFLIQSFDKVLYIQKLLLMKEAKALATRVQDFERKNGKMVLKDSKDKIKLQQFTIDPVALHCATAPPRELSLFQLARLMPNYLQSQSERSIEVQLAFFQKLFHPLFLFAALIISCCTTLNFSRKGRFFSLLTTALALMSIQIILQGFTVLARASWVTPTTALIFPWLSIFIILRYLYKKTTSYL